MTTAVGSKATSGISKATSGMLLPVAVIGFLVTIGYALSQVLSVGHASFATSSDGVSWGLPVVTYVFLAMTSTGLALVAALGSVFGNRACHPIVKRCTWLSIATLVGGFTALALELGHPFRMLWAIPTGMQMESPLFWMGVFYLIALGLLALKFFKIHSGDWGGKLLGQASVVVEVAALGTLGLAFGMLAMRPAWYGTAIPVSFMLAGMAAGMAAAVFTIYLSHGMDQERMPTPLKGLMQDLFHKIFAATLFAYLTFFVFHNVTGVWSNAEGLQVFEDHVSSVFFHLEWIGLVVALFLMANPGTRRQGNMQILAAVLALVALFIGRYEYIVGGQLVPLFKGAWVPELIQYTPSMTEWMATGAGLFLALAIYAIGDRFLNLADQPQG